MNGCPYRAMGKICTHVGMPNNRKHKTICPFKSGKKCELYCEWVGLKSNTELSMGLQEASDGNS